MHSSTCVQQAKHARAIHPVLCGMSRMWWGTPPPPGFSTTKRVFCSLNLVFFSGRRFTTEVFFCDQVTGGGGSPYLGGGVSTLLLVAHGFHGGPWRACVILLGLFVNPSEGVQVANCPYVDVLCCTTSLQGVK